MLVAVLIPPLCLFRLGGETRYDALGLFLQLLLHLDLLSASRYLRRNQNFDWSGLRPTLYRRQIYDINIRKTEPRPAGSATTNARTSGTPLRPGYISQGFTFMTR